MPKQQRGVPPWMPFWKNGSFRYDFRVDGERFRRSTGVRDPEALEIAMTVAQGVYDGAWQRALSPAPTFAEAAELYTARFGKHAQELERIVAYFRVSRRVDEIDEFDKEACRVALTRPGWKPGTARRAIMVPLNAVINFIRGLRPKSRDEERRHRILTPEQAERLIAVAMDPPASVRDPDRRLLKMIAFLLGSGASPGEMFCVRADNVHRGSGEVWIRGQETGAGKTPYRPRMLRLPPRAWELMGELPNEGRIFLSTRGKEIVPDGERGSTAIRQFRKLCAAANLPERDEHGERLVFYTCRHSWATWFSAQVGDQDLLVDRGGWAKADMARHYRKQAPRDLADRLLAHGWDFRECA